MDVIRGYNEGRGKLGSYEQSFIHDLGLDDSDIIGEGGETVSFRSPGGSVYKAFRAKDDKWAARGGMSAEQRADATVAAGEIDGFAPPARKVSDRIVEQEHVPRVYGSDLKTSLLRGDDRAVASTLRGLKRYHDGGITLGDANLTNVLDISETEYLTVDPTKWRYSDDYVSTELAKLHGEALYHGRGGAFLGAVSEVYGNWVASELEARRAA